MAVRDSPSYMWVKHERKPQPSRQSLDELQSSRQLKGQLPVQRPCTAVRCLFSKEEAQDSEWVWSHCCREAMSASLTQWNSERWPRRTSTRFCRTYLVIATHHHYPCYHHIIKLEMSPLKRAKLHPTSLVYPNCNSSIAMKVFSPLLLSIMAVVAVRAITVSVSSSGGVAASPLIYGLMFEDINHSGDGGM